MNEGSGDQDSCAEMPREKEEMVWNGETREAFRDYGERACYQMLAMLYNERKVAHLLY